MTVDIAETLLQAMQMVANKSLEAIKFDVTIEATIEDASLASQGKYLVSTGATKFYAYSTDSNYREKDTVMVTVPEGNYDNQKIILCKKVEKNETAVSYQSPFEHMIDVTNNLIYNYWDGNINRKNIEKGIYANYNNVYSGCPWNVNETSFLDSAIYTEYINFEKNKNNVEYTGKNPCIWDSGELDTPFSQYTRLGLKGQFSTWLDSYQTVSGNYGICLMVKFQSQEQTENENNSFFNFFTLDSDLFYGDPYGFETYYTQEAIFDISEYQNYLIKRLTLFIYQRNNFKNLNGEMIEAPSGEDFSNIVPNIYIKDPYISLGYETDNFTADSCLIYTNDSLVYNKYIESNNDYEDRNNLNKKIVSLRWIHKDDITKHITSLTQLPSDDYEIRWYHRKIGAPSPDDFAGANYELLPFLDEDNSNSSGGFAKRIKINNLDEYDDFNIEYYPDVNVQEDVIKAIVVKIRSNIEQSNVIEEKSIAQSNLLTFQNKDVIITSQDVIQREALGIKCEDLQRGHYAIYQRNGKLLRDMDAKEIRYLTAVFDYSDSNINLYSKALLSEATSVTWYFPVKNTMIKPYQITGVDVGDGIYNRYIANPSAYYYNENGQNENNCYQFAYTIYPTLYQSYSNNTIRLEVEKDGITYSADITLTFNVAGSSGSAYTLDILWDNNDNILDVSNENDKISGQVVLYDQDGKLIDIPDEAEVELDWYVATGGSGNIYEEGNILYPAFNGIDSRYGWNENTANENGEYYFYNLLNNQFEKVELPDNVDFSINRERTLYRTKIAGETNKKKLKYKKIKLVAENIDQPTEAELNTFYNNKLNGYIKINNIYIINPYRSNSENDIQLLRNTDAYTVEEANINESGTLTFDFEDLTNNIFQKSKDRFNIKFKSVNIDSLNILKVILTNFGDYDLIALFPIPLKNGDSYQGIDGATQVRYSTLGECDYIRNPYSLFKLDNNQLKKVDNIIWRLYPLNNSDGQFAPQISDKNILKPYPVYVIDATPYGIQARINGQTVWNQPILVYQDSYPSTTLNQWNGKDIQINDEDGTIVANGIAAGKKDENNSFTGVVLGDWSRTDIDQSLIKNTGVYGMHQGSVVYALKDDGTMFLGKGAGGRIVFDGNGGTITGSGLSINLKSGNIGGSNFDLTGGSSLELHSSGNPAYFRIKNGNSTLINIASGSYYLQSANYNAGNSGSSFNLNNGAFESQNATIRGTIYATSGTLGTLRVEGTLTGGTISGSTISGGSIRIGSNFSVDNSGNMTATSANISGSINATSGTLHSLNVTGTLNFSGSGAIEGSEIRVPAGATTASSSYFIVERNGNVSMSGGIKATEVDANTGQIGGWRIASGGLSSGTTVLDSSIGRIQTDYFVVNYPNNNYSLGEIGNLKGMTIEGDQYITTNLLGIHCTNGDGILLQAGNVQVVQNNGSGRFRYVYNGNIRLTANQIFIDTDDINSAFFNNQVDDVSLKSYILAVVNGII